MSNTEAIQTLKLMLSQVEWDYPMEYSAAIDEAIKALEAQKRTPMNDDLISRAEAIIAVEKSRQLNHHTDKKAISAHEHEHRHFMRILAELPPAQPDNRLTKIADLMDGTIDHFDLDDAMDLLYQIKGVLKDG